MKIVYEESLVICIQRAAIEAADGGRKIEYVELSAAEISKLIKDLNWHCIFPTAKEVPSTVCGVRIRLVLLPGEYCPPEWIKLL